MITSTAPLGDVCLLQTNRTAFGGNLDHTCKCAGLYRTPQVERGCHPILSFSHLWGADDSFHQ